MASGFEDTISLDHVGTNAMENTMDYRNLKPHPLAKLFPKYGEEELRDVASMTTG
jgi:hypothetical protein